MALIKKSPLGMQNAYPRGASYNLIEYPLWIAAFIYPNLLFHSL